MALRSFLITIRNKQVSRIEPWLTSAFVGNNQIVKFLDEIRNKLRPRIEPSLSSASAGNNDIEEIFHEYEEPTVSNDRDLSHSCIRWK